MVTDDEIGELWAKVSEIDKRAALNEQSIKVNRERIDNLMNEKFNKQKNQFERWNSDATRANNIKIAVIGVLAAAVPTIIMLAVR